MKYYFAAAISLCGVLFPTSSLHAATLTNFITYNGHTYAVTDVGSSWTEAEAFAVSQGGHLVTINDAAENAFIFETFVAADNLDYWIGFNCVGCSNYLDATQWGWSSGETSTFENFRAGQPDWGSGSDRFAVINFAGVGAVWDNYPDASFGTPKAIIEFDDPQSVSEPFSVLGFLTLLGFSFVIKHKNE